MVKIIPVEVFGVPRHLRFNVNCPKCGKCHEQSVTVYIQMHKKGEFSFVTNRADSLCGGC